MKLPCSESRLALKFQKYIMDVHCCNIMHRQRLNGLLESGGDSLCIKFCSSAKSCFLWRHPLSCSGYLQDKQYLQSYSILKFFSDWIYAMHLERSMINKSCFMCLHISMFFHFSPMFCYFPKTIWTLPVFIGHSESSKWMCVLPERISLIITKWHEVESTDELYLKLLEKERAFTYNNEVSLEASDSMCVSILTKINDDLYWYNSN